MENNEQVIITGKGSVRRNSISIIFLFLAGVEIVFGFLIISSAFKLTIILIICAAVFYVLAIAFSKYQITVTNKRITGERPFGKQADLPLDTISSAVKRKYTISVSTSLGNIRFVGIANSEQIFIEINKLLAERENLRSTPTAVNR